MLIEEKDNPRVQGAVLEIRGAGIACLDPSTAGAVAMLMYNERSVKGQPETPGLSTTITGEAQPFLPSYRRYATS